jgi:outer membrane immunogenic protein
MEKTMKNLYALLVCGTALLVASPAFAQDYDDEADLPDTPADMFSGPHIELSAGLDHVGFKSYKDIDPTQNFSTFKTGAVYGGAIGYDTPLTEQLTIGVELGVTTSSVKYANPALTAGTFNAAQINVGRDISFGLRLGYALNNKTQVFAKVAYTNTHFGVTGTDGSEALYDGIAANGARVGIGVERHFTRALYVKLEYDRSQYGSGQFNYRGSTPDASYFDLRNSRDQLLASIGVRF